MCFIVSLAGSKAAPVGIGSKPVGIGSAAAGQAPGPDGENVLTKILQGGAAEQAGKLGDGMIIFYLCFAANCFTLLEKSSAFLIYLNFLCQFDSFVWTWEEVHLIVVNKNFASKYTTFFVSYTWITIDIFNIFIKIIYVPW